MDDTVPNGHTDLKRGTKKKRKRVHGYLALKPLAYDSVLKMTHGSFVGVGKLSQVSKLIEKSVYHRCACMLPLCTTFTKVLIVFLDVPIHCLCTGGVPRSSLSNSRLLAPVALHCST